MDPLRSRSVFRYFVPADAFVRIVLHDPRESALVARPGLNRQAYRRLVIESCCPEFRGELARLAKLCPEDPLAAEDLLYQLSVELNPHLDIHTVRLAERVEADPSECAEPRPSPSPADALSRLRRRSRGLEQRLKRRVVGQERAVESVARAIRRAAAGLAPDDRPLGTFLFVGRTGTGKTELARALARELHPDDPSALIRVDCSEYGAAHEYAKLIGAPPGYVGHEHGGFLTDAVRRRPDSVVLFDEVEKAHAKLHQLLLQVLDEGRLADGRGRRVDFTRALIVLTSNVGAAEIRDADRRVGFARDSGLARTGVEEITSRALESEFSPEFLARLDERIVFRDLEPPDAREIAARLLEELAVRVRRRRGRVAFADSVAAWVAERGFRPDSGARELRRVVQREIEAPLAELLLERDPGRGLIRVSVRGGAPSFRIAA